MRAAEVGEERDARVQGSIPPRAVDGRHRSRAHDIGVTSAGKLSPLHCLCQPAGPDLILSASSSLRPHPQGSEWKSKVCCLWITAALSVKLEVPGRGSGWGEDAGGGGHGDGRMWDTGAGPH